MPINLPICQKEAIFGAAKCGIIEKHDRILADHPAACLLSISTNAVSAIIARQG